MKTAVAAVFAALAWLVHSQDQNASYHAHGAVAFIRTGERTPNLRPGVPYLTATGANQMFTLGQNFRHRYISGGADNRFGSAYIAGMSPNILDNSQIHVRSPDSPYLVSSAEAFMQGLYPPFTNSNGTGSGDILADGTIVNYPLDGYQYASVLATSALDPDSIFLAGSRNCPAAQNDQMLYYFTGDYSQTKLSTRGLYQELDPDWFENHITKQQLSYTFAPHIADYLEIQYLHNSSVHRSLSNDSSLTGVYDKVRWYADQQSWFLYGNTSASNTDSDNRAIAGKTLAAAILGRFQVLIADRTGGSDTTDMSWPLTFFFGEQDPMISLISLMEVDYHNENFRAVPYFGSSMVFELFTTGTNASFPDDTSTLNVRFYYHNGSTATDPFANQFQAFPFFGNGPSRQDMSWNDFQDMSSHIMMNKLSDWCATCGSPSIFCWDDFSPSRGGSPENTSKMTPLIAGVTGAIVALAVATILFVLVMPLAGLRFRCHGRSGKSGLGGFKGSSKLASDPDISLAKNAEPPAGASFVPAATVNPQQVHERVGSWELRQKELGASRLSGSTVDDRHSFEGIDAVASKPVEIHERV